MTAAQTYARHKSKKLQRYVQTPLSQKPLLLSPVFVAFFQYTQNLLHFLKKGQFDSLNIWEVIDCEKYGFLNARKLPF